MNRLQPVVSLLVALTSSAALAAGKVDAQHVDDTLFDAGFAGTVSVRYNTDKPVGLSILVR